MIDTSRDPVGLSPPESPVLKPPPRAISPQAQRALNEATARRRAAEEHVAALPRELHGRGGAEPVRFGDWEIKGLAVDF